MSPDEALERLEAIGVEFSEFCSQRGRVSEADTRAKVVDAVVRDVRLARALHLPRGPG